jgi:hypothetical protein
MQELKIVPELIDVKSGLSHCELSEIKCLFQLIIHSDHD